MHRQANLVSHVHTARCKLRWNLQSLNGSTLCCFRSCSVQIDAKPQKPPKGTDAVSLASVNIQPLSLWLNDLAYSAPYSLLLLLLLFFSSWSSQLYSFQAIFSIISCCFTVFSLKWTFFPISPFPEV